jgi:hypothetical protein
VSESLKKALARTAKLQTKSDTQSCILWKEEKKVVNITGRLKRREQTQRARRE